MNPMPPPRLWEILVGPAWLALRPARAWVLWRAVIRAQWSLSVTWRQEFLALARDLATGVQQDGHVLDGLRALTALPRLVELLETLMSERVLLKHDGHAIEEYLFKQVDAAGQWTNERRP
jgi:hypothetical protein